MLPHQPVDDRAHRDGIHRPPLLSDFGDRARLRSRPGLVAFEQDRHAVVGQCVVGRDDVGCDAEQTEHEHGDEPGAVLARRAVEDERLRVTRRDQVQDRDEAVTEAVEHEQVEVVEWDHLPVRPLAGIPALVLPARLVDDRDVRHRDRELLELLERAVGELAAPRVPRADR